ncbi:MAG: ABC transporter substrate-binding protein [Defluviitaleaceae bacterium]|nr:ABC transporter substrate-binding protein [Defluviitaleaceae bacterium]MCL2262108.1 ABC transporter substrate-binding protein [Defluviitaleaceae bacterium]
MKISAAIIIILLLAACGTGERISPSGLPYIAAAVEEYENEIENGEVEPAEEPLTAPVTARTLPDDGVLRLHMRPPMTLNPLANEDVTVARILRLIFEPLAVLDNEFRVTGHLAEFEFASDFGSVNATIREGAIWSDGKPVTADDIIFSIDFLRRAPLAAIYRANVNEIESAIRLDSRRVQINFTRASVMAAYSLTFPVIPQHFFEDPRATQGQNPPGNGAFIINTVTPMRYMTLTRNPYFSRGRARIERAEVIFLPNMETDFHAFERGRTDVIHLSLTEWTRHHGVRSPVYEIFPAMYFEFIGFNFRNTVFRDIHTRQGIAHAFNACDAVAGLYLAHAVRTVTPIHPHNHAANATIRGPIYDPARAAALLGTVRITEPLIIIANAENRQRTAIAKRLATSLDRVGIPAYAEILPSAKYFERLANHDFDMFIGGMELPFAPDVRVFFEAGELFLRDPILEAAFSALQFASTEAAYAHAKTRLQQAFAEQLPVIGLAFKHSAILTGQRVTGNLSPAPCHVFINAFEWKIS